MRINQDDIDQELDPLPVYKGCYGPCACSGACREIIGSIDRKKYVDFVENFVSFDVFISHHLIKTEVVEETREVLNYEVINLLDRNGAINKRYALVQDLHHFSVHSTTKEIFDFIVKGGETNPIFILPNKLAKIEVGKILDQYFEVKWKTHYK